MDKRRLFRSRENKMLCGVCGGIGEYFGIDATFIRLLWVALLIIRPWRIVFHSFFGGSLLWGSIVIYIVAAIIIPLRNNENY